MRGKAVQRNAYTTTARITPAYAGKSGASLCKALCKEDHPRVCGEKVRGYVKIWNEWGSPPRMRGKDVKFTFDAGKLRITPAYAGKSKAGSVD